jgi:hypothetical protein
VCLIALAGCSSGNGHRNSAEPAGSKAATPTTTTTGKRSRSPNRAAAQVHADGNGRTFAVPGTIDATCADDVTGALQSFVDQLPDHATVTFTKDGCYRIEGTLELERRSRLVLDGNGATLRATTAGSGGRLQVRSRSHLSIRNSSDVVVRDLTVQGANPHAGLAPDAYQPALEAQHAFALLGDDGVTLDHVGAHDVYGDFVYVGGAGGPSRNVTIEHSVFARSGRQGISVTDGENVSIVDNRIDDVARSVIDLEPNVRSGVVRGIRIERNTTGRARNFWLADKGAGVNVGDVVVTGNTMHAPTGALVIVVGPKFGRRGPFSFVGNRLTTDASVTDARAKGAFLFSHVTGVTLRDNDVRLPAAAHLAGVELRTTDGVVLQANTFPGATRPVLADATSHYRS